MALLLVIAMLTAMIPAAAAEGIPFIDVKENDWFYEYVDFVWSKGYFEGVSDTEFDPKGTMTRAMFVTVLARLDEAEVDNSVSAFDDVPVNTWYTGSVTWAAANGIVDGVAAGKFNPNCPVTREQMCAIMDRYIKYYSSSTGAEHEKEENAANLFKDAHKISAYAVDCVENCRLLGLVDGFEDGTFRPAESSTRAQVASVIFRLAWVAKGETGGGGGAGGGDDTPTPSPSPSPESTTYTVTFDATTNGGSLPTGTANTKTVAANSTYGPLPTPAERTGYTFNGWFTSATGGTKVESYTKVTTAKNHTIYAQWTDCVDYIKIAVDASMSALQSNYNKYMDIAKDKADNRFFDASSAFTFDFSPYIDPPAGDYRPQTINASLTLAANFKRDAIVNAAYYAGAATIGTVLGRSEAKEFVEPYIDELNDWFEEKGINDSISKAERDEIIDRVYNALKNKGTALWDNFKGEDGKYYTGGVTLIAAPGKSYEYSSRIELPDSNTNRRTYTKEMAKVASKLAIALTKEIYDSTTLATDWEDELSLTGTLTFHFADSKAYKEHTEQFPHFYPFTINMSLIGNGIVFYKFVDGVPYAKLVIDQDTQDLYDESVNAAVEKLLTEERVIKEIRTEAKNMISSYVDLENGPFADKIPADIAGKFDKATLEGILHGILRAWFYQNADIHLNPASDPEHVPNVPESNLYKYCWLGDKTVNFNNTALEPLADACADFDTEVNKTARDTVDKDLRTEVDKRKPEIEKRIEAYIDAEIKAHVADKLGVYNPTQQQIDKYVESNRVEIMAEVENSAEATAKCQSIFSAEVATLENKLLTDYNISYTFDLTGISYATWKAELESIVFGNNPDSLVNTILSSLDIPTSGNIVESITNEILGHKYMEYLEKATNVRTFDSADDITLGNLATVFSNDRAQATIKEKISDKNQSYLFKLAAQFDKVPEGVSIEVTKTGTTQSFTIDYKLVEDVKVADTVEEICDALAAIFGQTGIKDLALSEFYGEGQTLTFLYKTHSPSCVVCVEAK